MSICFHKWSKWIEYVREYKTVRTFDGHMIGDWERITEIWQRKECQKCGLARRKRVLPSWEDVGHPLKVKE